MGPNIVNRGVSLDILKILALTSFVPKFLSLAMLLIKMFSLPLENAR